MALTKIPASFLDKSSHVDFADSEEIRLGTGNDLRIFHAGTENFIRGNATESPLYIDVCQNLHIRHLDTDGGNAETMIKGIGDGAVELYHNNGKKFETSATGASVTGNLAVSGNLTVSGTTTELDTTNLNVTDKNITLNYHASSDTSSNANGAGLTIQDGVDASNDATLLWDTTNDRFDLSHNLHIGTANQVGSASVPALQIGGTSTYRLGMYTTSEGAIIDNANGDDGIIFHTKTAGESMRITSEGDVGIGTTSPNNYSGYTTLTLNHATTGGIIDFEVNGTLHGEIYSNNTGIGIQTAQADDSIFFKGNDGGSTITALTLDMADAGTATFNAGVVSANNSDTQSIFGRTALGFVTGLSDYAYVGHLDVADSGGYALVQSSAGATFLNAETGQDLSFSIHGTRKMVLDSSGNVGIGNTNPSGMSSNANKLVVGTGSGDQGMSVYAGTSTGRYAFARAVGNNTDAYDGGMAYDGSRNLTFHTNANAERMRIDGSGYVGIGTGSSSINAPLEISGAAAMAGGWGRSMVMRHNFPTIVWQSEYSTDAYAGIGYDNTTGMHFMVNSPTIDVFANSQKSAMFIRDDKRIGIGTTSPTAKLEISGKDDAEGATDLLALQFDNSPADTGMTFTDIFSGVQARFTLDSGNTNNLRISSGSTMHFYGGTSNGTGDGHLKINSSGHFTSVYGMIVTVATFAEVSNVGFGSYNNGAWVNSKSGTNGWLATAGNGVLRWSTGNVFVNGALSKNSGSFKIPHPLPSKNSTHALVHSFIEGPQADNIYRGVVDLVDGTATINIDTVSGMTEGTYVLLNTNTSCFTSNETNWDAVKGSVSGNILTINCQNSSSTATVSWLVIGERHDQHMKDTDWTDSDGKVIVEPLKEQEVNLGD